MYKTIKAHIEVSAKSKFINISAENFNVRSFINERVGIVNFTGLLKDFQLKSKLLNKAFNNKLINMRGYINFVFRGKILNLEEVNFNKDGLYVAKVFGELVIGDEKRETSATVPIKIKGNRITTIAEFSIRIEEKNVKKVNSLMQERIPKAFRIDIRKLGISRDIGVTLKAKYQLDK